MKKVPDFTSAVLVPWGQCLGCAWLTPGRMDEGPQGAWRVSPRCKWCNRPAIREAQRELWIFLMISDSWWFWMFQHSKDVQTWSWYRKKLQETKNSVPFRFGVSHVFPFLACGVEWIWNRQISQGYLPRPYFESLVYSNGPSLSLDFFFPLWHKVSKIPSKFLLIKVWRMWAVEHSWT